MKIKHANYIVAFSSLLSTKMTFSRIQDLILTLPETDFHIQIPNLKESMQNHSRKKKKNKCYVHSTPLIKHHKQLPLLYMKRSSKM